jgi:hypothetical protein
VNNTGDIVPYASYRRIGYAHTLPYYSINDQTLSPLSADQVNIVAGPDPEITFFQEEAFRANQPAAGIAHVSYFGYISGCDDLLPAPGAPTYRTITEIGVDIVRTMQPI